MPDAIPIAGLSDDLAVLIYVLKVVWTDIDPEVTARAKASGSTTTKSRKSTTFSSLSNKEVVAAP